MCAAFHERVLQAARRPSDAIRYRAFKAAAWWLRRTSSSYTDYFRRLMRFQIRWLGPDRAVGGFEHGIGKLQFEFLLRVGLRSEDRLLDIGCGCLRGGEHYIRYLEPGNYVGMDICPEIIDAGKERVGQTLLERRRPRFIVNDDLRFEEIGEPVNVAVAQSVFTHLPEDQIRECLAHLDRALAPGGRLYATFFTEGGASPQNFAYEPKTLLTIAEEHDLAAQVLPRELYPHPRGQRMLTVRLPAKPDHEQEDALAAPAGQGEQLTASIEATGAQA